MEDFINFVASILGINRIDITEESEYGSIEQWDSLMQIRLVAEIEEKYDVDIPMSEIASIKKIKDFYNYITE
jgi:acyl carrier protein